MELILTQIIQVGCNFRKYRFTVGDTSSTDVYYLYYSTIWVRAVQLWRALARKLFRNTVWALAVSQ